MQSLGIHSGASGFILDMYIFDAFMDKTYDIRKLGGDKIALLGLFALSLLTARIVVGIKSTLILSEPIPLPGTSISVAVPTGNGWQSQERWTTGINIAFLKSSFSAGPGKPTAEVTCRYRPTVKASSIRMLFEQKAREFDGVIVTIDQIVTDSLIFDWAQIKGEKQPSTAFLGTAVLSEDWQLDIEVIEVIGDVEQAEETFMRVVESVNLKDGRPRTALSWISEEEDSL
ncbi:MAG: hypothetical protein JSW59_19015 [Phycisphaerales bacterium]|nr:MAG: hypothetical protein JSW59_19015 [Phycisphaerales bacterium]